MEAYLPFDVIHIMRRLFTLFRKSIEEQGGCIVETAGDGLYAVFGMKPEREPAAAAQAAVAAGACILGRLEEFNDAYLARHFNHRFQVGIGIHAGKVIVGNVGIGVNNNLTVMGLPVVIAARLQAATRRLNNSLVVSDKVYRMLELPDAVPGTEMPLKGMVQGVRVHLLGKKFAP